MATERLRGRVWGAAECGANVRARRASRRGVLLAAVAGVSTIGLAACGAETSVQVAAEP
ncbi:MAG: hypothetical protein FJ029_10990 [Actinobacteria bacterium]|nr:hypothetical protein [Actinomycetota bacterium]